MEDDIIDALSPSPQRGGGTRKHGGSTSATSERDKENENEKENENASEITATGTMGTTTGGGAQIILLSPNDVNDGDGITDGSDDVNLTDGMDESDLPNPQTGGKLGLVTSHSNSQVSLSSRSNDDNNVEGDDMNDSNEDSKQIDDDGDGQDVNNSKNNNENKKDYVQTTPTVDLNLNGRESVNTQVWNQAKLASRIDPNDKNGKYDKNWKINKNEEKAHKAMARASVNSVDSMSITSTTIQKHVYGQGHDKMNRDDIIQE